MSGLPSASFRSSLNRFEEYNEVRHKKFNREEDRNSHLGPGAYDPNDDTVSIYSRCTSPKMYPEQMKDEKNFVSAAPPVGTYDIQRDLSPTSFAHVENSSSRNMTSSFRSCGREKPLMGCAKVYMTLREDLRTTNRGPGMYLNVTPSFGGRVSYSPTLSDPRHRANMASSLSTAGSVSSMEGGYSPHKQSRAPISDLWRPSTSARAEASASANEKKTASIKQSFISDAELKRNIAQVRGLPDYPR